MTLILYDVSKSLHMLNWPINNPVFRWDPNDSLLNGLDTVCVLHRVLGTVVT